MSVAVAVILLGIAWPPGLRAQGAGKPTCVPTAMFSLGAVRIGMRADSVLAQLGRPSETRRDTTEGADWVFPLVRYRYRDLEVTISQASGRVSEIKALTGTLATGTGVRLGMRRRDVERSMPGVRLRASTNDAGQKAYTAEACGGGRATDVWLVFDERAVLTQLQLVGFLPSTDDRGRPLPD
ncbi:MAG: hypothetical protein Q8K82_03950 [Gemmatimonadaceae bacterium]|nr:hypothetical protein [Gemmatimonadaceae bacterium]